MRLLLSVAACVTLLAACAERPLPDYAAASRARNDAAIAERDYRLAHPSFTTAHLEDQRQRAEDADRQAASYRAAGIKPSDVSDCRSRANTAFADLAVKHIISDDCLESRRLRRAGR